MKRVLILTLGVMPLVAGCSLFGTDTIPPRPGLAGVNAQNVAWEGEVKRTPDGAAFIPLVEARTAVNEARSQRQVEAYDADSLAQAEAALARAETGWQEIAESKSRPAAKLASVADEAHRAQRLAEIARYTAVREINLDQLLAVNEQLEKRRSQQSQRSGRPAASGLSAAGADLVGQRVIPDQLGDVSFDPGTARMTAPSAAVVRRLATLMQNNPKYGVAIFGHTDNTVPAAATIRRFVNANPGLEEQAPTQAEKVKAFNLALSSARARAVAQMLVQNGVEARRIGARGLGDARPVASNETAEGRRANRRIEAVIVPGPDSQAAQQARSGRSGS